MSPILLDTIPERAARFPETMVIFPVAEAMSEFIVASCPVMVATFELSVVI